MTTKQQASEWFGPWQGVRWGGSILIFAAGFAVLMSQASTPYKAPDERAARALRTEVAVGVWRPKEQTLRPVAGMAHAPQRRNAPVRRQPPRPVPQPQPTPIKKEAPPAPQAVVHVVKDGEHLWGIAADYLGAGWRWEQIAAANPNVDPDRMREGTTLVIPGARPKEGSRPAAANSRELAGGADRERQQPTTPPKVRFHVVKDGETLSEIAAFYYDDNDWNRIRKANRLKDPKDLRTGARLVIPPERS